MFSHPDSQDVFDAVGVDADRDVRRLVAHVRPVADLDDERVEVEHRVELLQRPGLPGFDPLEHRIGDLADRLAGQLGAQRALQVGLDVADRHPAGVEADDLLVQPAQAALALGDQPGGEAGVPVAGHVQAQRPDLAGDRLGCRAVAAVGTAPPRRVPGRIAQMVGELGGQPPLQHRFDHLGEEAAFAGQPDPAVGGAVDQLVEPAVVGEQLAQLPARGPSRPDQPFVIMLGRTMIIWLVRVSRVLDHSHPVLLSETPPGLRFGPRLLVGSAWGAVPRLLSVRFPRPPAEPDVRLSPHPALHARCGPHPIAGAGFGVQGVAMFAPR